MLWKFYKNIYYKRVILIFYLVNVYLVVLDKNWKYRMIVFCIYMYIKVVNVIVY